MSFLEDYNNTKENFENSTKAENSVSKQNANTVEGMHFDVDLADEKAVYQLGVELMSHGKTAEAGELANQQLAYQVEMQKNIEGQEKQESIKEEIEHQLS